MHKLLRTFSFLLLSLNIALTVCANEMKQPEPYKSATDLGSFMMHNSTRIPGSKQLNIQQLSNNNATLILSKAENTDRITWLIDPKIEKKLIESQKSNVTRTGNTLSIKTLSGKTIKFKNTFKPESKTYDGDSTKYFYAGMLPSTGYHMVESDYMHDSPSRYFVNANTGLMLYSNISEHSVYLLNQNKLLVINGSFNPPFGLVITSINEQRHKIDLHCLGHNKTGGMPSVSFKGWLDTADEGFALVLSEREAGKQNSKQQNLIPIQFKLTSGSWHIYAPKNQINAISEMFSCWQPQ